jgi:large subunit ribosomal protein L29
MDKYSDLIKLDKKELFEKVALLRKESLNLRFQKSSGQLEKTARVRQVKKQIARLKTAITAITAIKMKGNK